MDYSNYFTQYPDSKGEFEGYGGAYLPPPLIPVFAEITAAYKAVSNDAKFLDELRSIRKHFQGRPTPVFHAKSLSADNGGAQIYLKREDLNHTGAHKLNHCMGEGLLAKHLGKTKLIAETGAGQHGVALATASTVATRTDSMPIVSCNSFCTTNCTIQCSSLLTLGVA